MAKDGTNRGGRRTRAGKKPAPLYEKIQNGQSAVIIELPATELNGTELEKPEPVQGNEIPNPSEYLSQIQRDGNSLGADYIYRETWLWLKERGCEQLVNPRLLESYSQAFARFIQCEDAISRFGLLGKHPTTGGAIASPFVQMSQSYEYPSVSREDNETLICPDCGTREALASIVISPEEREQILAIIHRHA